jgi:hypothetical protein
MPSPRSRERFDQGVVRLRLCRKRKLAAVRCDNSLATTPALEPHGDPHDQRRALEPGLDAAHHAAFLSLCCRSSPTKLTSPSALIRTSSAFSCTSTRSTSSAVPSRLYVHKRHLGSPIPSVARFCHGSLLMPSHVARQAASYRVRIGVVSIGARARRADGAQGR